MTIDQRKAKGLTVNHLSWWRILTAAIVQKEHRGIEDPDQAWILEELIRYLEDDRSGASRTWVTSGRPSALAPGP